MKNGMMFDVLLEEVLQETANPALPHGLEERVTKAACASDSPVADVLVLAGGLSGESLFASLWSGIRDVLAPRKMSPLALESKPVPMVDGMAGEREHSSTAYAVAVHAAAVLLIGFVVRAQVREVEPEKKVVAQLIEPVLHLTTKPAERNGGGGGQRGEVPVSKGHLPKLADQQIVPPSNPQLLPPKIVMEPSIVVQQDIKLADNIMPNVGMPNSPLVGVSMGDGRGTGIGPGDGPGMGPGSGGNTGGGLRHVGGSVSQPRVLYQVEPEFSEEARKAKVSGDVMVYLWVDEQGRPTHVRVVRGMGYGLDEKALDAVKQYRFKPAMENGKAVTVEMYVAVDFHIY